MCVCVCVRGRGRAHTYTHIRDGWGEGVGGFRELRRRLGEVGRRARGGPERPWDLPEVVREGNGILLAPFLRDLRT